MTVFSPHLCCIYYLPHKAQTHEIAGALMTLKPKCSVSRLGFYQI